MYKHQDFTNIDQILTDEEFEIEIEATIKKEPIMKNGKIQYVLSDIKNLKSNEYISGNLLMKNIPYPEYYYGDILKVKGLITKPEPFDGFLYNEYLSMKQIDGVFEKTYFIEYIETERSILQRLFFYKNLLMRYSRGILPEPHASFLAGLLFGSKNGMPKDVMDDFQTTGITHIIAISGYNISLIILIVLTLLSFLPRYYRLFFAGIFIFIFTVFVGPEASVVRASIMGIIMLLSMYFGRSAQITNTLYLTAFCMVFLNPRVLIYDVGFQLSFLATIGLVYVSPLIEKYFLWITSFLSIRDSFLLTMSAQITAVPIIMYHFGTLSIISPLVNLLVSPFIPLAMLFGSLSLFIGFVNFPLAMVISLPSYISLEIILKIADFFAKIPFSSVNIIKVNFIYFYCYYFLLAFFILYKSRQVL